MTQVRIPPVYDGAGAQVAATVDVRLIAADGRQVLAFNATELATEYQAVAIPADAPEGLLLDLAPTSALALPSGAATWYQITLRTPHRTEVYRVQVADDPGLEYQELRDLVAAAAVDPADILAGRLLPDASQVGEAQWLTTTAWGWVATDAPPGSGVPEAPLTDGPYGRQAGAWVEAVGPAGPQGIQGLPGADGADGAQGPQGIQGPAGADGAQGPQGIQGPAGPAGANGLDGAQGPAGPAGADGADGAQGPQGPAGPQGSAGADGAQGPQGIQGLPGADGAQGPQGIQGPAGATGAQGPAGPTAVSADAGNLAVLGTDSLLLVDAAHVTPAAIGAQAAMTAASQAEMETGTESAIRSMSPLRVAQAIAVLAGNIGMQCRLSLSSTDPTSDVASSSTIYLIGYIGEAVSLWNGSKWISVSASGVSLEIGSVTPDLPYDVFVYLNSGTAALQLVAWASASARATAIDWSDGRRIKAGNKTHLLVGSVLPDTTGTIADKSTHRGVSNIYNRLSRYVDVTLPQEVHSYTTNSWREYNAGTGVNRLKVVSAIPDRIQMSSKIQLFGGAGAIVGVGPGSTAYGAGVVPAWSAAIVDSSNAYIGMTPIGYRYYTMVEFGSSGATFAYPNLSGSISS